MEESVTRTEVAVLSRIGVRMGRRCGSCHGGPEGVWDEEERLKKLERKKPSLERLGTAIPWEDFRPLPESIFQQERKGPAGRKGST